VIARLSMRTRVLAAALVVAVAAPVASKADPADGGWQYQVDLGAGLKFKPKYPGANDYILVPYPIASVSRFYLPGLGQVGTRASGFSLYPSFEFQRKRTASDSPSLTGTTTIDWALELGAGVAFRRDWLRTYVQARQGFNGHHGQVVDVGVEVTARPTDRLRVIVGPRATWASGDYMSTYFGVTSAEAIASGGTLTAYSPGAGFQSVGILARAEYAITERTTFHVRAGWQRLIGDAADSPIVKLGDADQFTIGAGLSRKFGFDLFR
jgi:outer membrane scaffolding protein for murein synthesis (MipA/OmpV family)